MPTRSTQRAASTRSTRPHARKTTATPRNWRKVFLRELAVDGNRQRAAEVAGVDRKTVYNHRASDAAFRAEWDAAIDQAGEYLEAEAWRRATEGVTEPLTCGRGLVYHEDGSLATVQKYSDSLMQTLLRGARPQKYRDNVSVSAPAALGVTVVLESIQNDPRYAERANELVRLIAGAGTADPVSSDQ